MIFVVAFIALYTGIAVGYILAHIMMGTDE